MPSRRRTLRTQADIEILAAGPIPLDRLEITWTDSQPVLSPAAAARIDERWNACVNDARARGRDLFNGPIVRGVSCDCRRGAVRLVLAPSDYRTFLVTALRDRAWFEANEPAAIAAAIGNSGLVTHGGTAYLGVRSARVAAYGGRWHVFGGVLDYDPRDPPTTAEGLLSHLYRELREELALTPDHLAHPPQLLAILRDPQLLQPELVWHCALRHPLDPGALHPHEHDRVQPVPRDQPGDPALLTPIALAAFRQWRAQ